MGEFEMFEEASDDGILWGPKENLIDNFYF